MVDRSKGSHHFRTELVHHLVLRYRQHIFFHFIDASVVLVEMEDVGGEKEGFPANVREGFLYVLLN